MCVEIISYFSFFHSPPFFKEGWSQTGVVFEVVLFSVMLNLFQHLIFNIVPYSTFILPSVIANPLPAGEAISILPTLLLLFILLLTSLILIRHSLFLFSSILQLPSSNFHPKVPPKTTTLHHIFSITTFQLVENH